jgi:hypothetical protein
VQIAQPIRPELLASLQNQAAIMSGPALQHYVVVNGGRVQSPAPQAGVATSMPLASAVVSAGLDAALLKAQLAALGAQGAAMQMPVAVGQHPHAVVNLGQMGLQPPQ